jgi:hypothetical protein
MNTSVADPDPHLWDPYAFGPLVPHLDHKYGSDFGFFHHQAKKENNLDFLLFCDFFMTFYL